MLFHSAPNRGYPVNTDRLLGIDDMCPCQSGKTFGMCCLREGRAAFQGGVPVIRMPGPPPELVELMKQDLQRQARFGHVRPAVHVNVQGQKWIAVDRELLHSPNWKTPLDFLWDYLKHVMTPAWGEAELAKPLADRHPVMQWCDAARRLHAAAKQLSTDGVCSVIPSGSMRAYTLLAYDLYVLQHHGLLEKRLLQRLRHKDQYQGARHELFAAATCVRAGFDIEYEDETDQSTKHTEFTATHRQTGFRLCVEAKSKHRSGVLGMGGDRVADDQIRNRLGGLINDAVNKPRKHPLAIFLDLNLPPESPVPTNTLEWLERFARPILRQIDKRGQGDPWDLLAFSNQPDHYATDDGPAPRGYVLGMLGKNTRIGSQPPSELMALIDAAKKFGSVPNLFEDM